MKYSDFELLNCPKLKSTEVVSFTEGGKRHTARVPWEFLNVCKHEAKITGKSQDQIWFELFKELQLRRALKR